MAAGMLLAAQFSPVASIAATGSVDPSVVYTPEQVAVCAPDQHTDVQRDRKKSRVGEGVTATATARVVASAGRAIDPRLEARDHRNDGVHVNRPGVPTLRYEGIHAVEASLTTGSRRGSSLRMGRTAEVRPILTAYTINATAACYEALGLFAARN
jgi:hypothetical protein